MRGRLDLRVMLIMVCRAQEGQWPVLPFINAWLFFQACCWRVKISGSEGLYFLLPKSTQKDKLSPLKLGRALRYSKEKCQQGPHHAMVHPVHDPVRCVRQASPQRHVHILQVLSERQRAHAQVAIGQRRVLRIFWRDDEHSGCVLHCGSLPVLQCKCDVSAMPEFPQA